MNTKVCGQKLIIIYIIHRTLHGLIIVQDINVCDLNVFVFLICQNTLLESKDDFFYFL